MATKPWHRWPVSLQSPDGILRLQIYQRDDNQCRLRLSGCTTIPTQLDHIVAPNQGGAWFDPANLRAACASCNNKRAKPKRRRPKRQMGNFTVVTGPSGAGKTTYVEAHAEPGDTVIDFDKLAAALGAHAPTRGATGRWQHPAHIRWITYAAWRASIAAAQKHQQHPAWLIHAHPKPGALQHYKQSGATIISIDPATHKPTTVHKPVRRTGKPTRPSRNW